MTQNRQANPSRLIDLLSKESLIRSDQNRLALETETLRTYEKVRQEPEEFTPRSSDWPSFLEQLEEDQRGLDFCAWYTVAAESNAYRKMTSAEKIESLVLLDMLHMGVPSSSESPDGFLTIRGDQLNPVTRMSSVSLLYVWVENCDPCDTIKADLEDLLTDIPNDVALLAMKGEENDELLMEEYDLIGAPSILLFLNTKIDVRLVGPYPPKTVLQEIERTRRKVN